MNIQKTDTGYTYTDDEADCPCTKGAFLGSYCVAADLVLTEEDKANGLETDFMYDVCNACGNVIGILG